MEHDSESDSEHASTDEHSDTESESLSENDPDSLDEIIEDISVSVQILVDMQDAYKHPMPDSIASMNSTKSLEQFVDPSPSKNYFNITYSKFPDANPSLIPNWKMVPRRKESIEQNKNPEDNNVPEVSGSEFHDSGLGSSLATTSYAETDRSFVGRDKYVARLPPLSDTAKSGNPRMYYLRKDGYRLQ